VKTIALLVLVTALNLTCRADEANSMQVIYPGQGSSNIRDHAPGYYVEKNPDGTKKAASTRTYGSFYGPGPGSPNGNATYGSFVHVTGQHE
jgi:hypothetical protein